MIFGLLQEQSRLSSLRIEQERQRITTRQQQLQNQKAQDSAAINLKAAKRELSRAQRAFEQGAMAEVDYEKARDDLDTAELFHKHSLMDTKLDIERLEFELQTRQLSVEQQELLAIEEFEGLDVAEFAGFLYEHPRALHLWRAKEERLARYRGMVRPDEQLTSEWITKVESALTKFERDADDSQ